MRLERGEKFCLFRCMSSLLKIQGVSWGSRIFTHLVNYIAIRILKIVYFSLGSELCFSSLAFVLPKHSICIEIKLKK